MTPLLDAAALESASEGQIQAVLDAYLGEQCSAEELTARLAAICTDQPNAAWHALSLLDQLQRRGILTRSLFQSLKEKLNEIVFFGTGRYFAIGTQSGSAAEEIGSDRKDQVQPSEHASVAESNPANLPPSEPIRAGAAILPHPANATPFDRVRPGAYLRERYLIIEPLFIDNASTTFKALDSQRHSLPEAERFVAIRWLEDRLQRDVSAIAALQNEYAILQGLAHGNIPKVYDFHDEPGERCIVMELPPGEFLNRIVERSVDRLLSIATALTIIREIGSALAHVHDRGAVHGNLHIGNVLVTQGGGIRIFGIAQADSWLGIGDLPDAALWGLSSAARRHASPQRRRLECPSSGDDLYSLASIAHELLTGAIVNQEMLRANRSCPSGFNRRVSARQWQTLCRGLMNSSSLRCADIRAWLGHFDMERAHWRLPSLVELETDVRHRRSHTGSAILKWLRSRPNT
jgi:hypothetical protein